MYFSGTDFSTKQLSDLIHSTGVTCARLFGVLTFVGISMYCAHYAFGVRAFPAAEPVQMAGVAAIIAVVGLFFWAWMTAALVFPSLIFRFYSRREAARAERDLERMLPVFRIYFSLLFAAHAFWLIVGTLTHMFTLWLYVFALALAPLAAIISISRLQLGKQAFLGYATKFVVSSLMWGLTTFIAAYAFAQSQAWAAPYVGAQSLIIGTTFGLFAIVNYRIVEGKPRRLLQHLAVTALAVVAMAGNSVVDFPFRMLNIEVPNATVTDAQDQLKGMLAVINCKSVRRLDGKHYAVDIMDALGKELVVRCNSDNEVSTNRSALRTLHISKDGMYPSAY